MTLVQIMYIDKDTSLFTETRNVVSNNFHICTGSHVAYLVFLVFCGAGADERSLHFFHSSIAATPAIADFGEVFRMNLSNLLKITSTSSELRCRLVHESLPHNF